jgi:hypothetical protein
MSGMTCNCSRCGILLRVMHKVPPGAPVLCVHCSGALDAPTQEPPRDRPAPERQARQRPAADEPPAPAASEPVVGGLVEDRGWERLQERQRKKMLGWSLAAVGGFVVLLVLVLVIASVGSGSKKKKGSGDAPAGERDRDSREEPAQRQREDEDRRPRRVEEEDPDFRGPVRPIPVPDNEPAP